MFPRTAEVDPSGRITSSLILTHLQTLSENLKKYIPSIAISQFDWVRNPSAVSLPSITHLPLKLQEEFAQLQEDRTFQLKFGQLSCAEFWLSTRSDYPELGKETNWVFQQ